MVGIEQYQVVAEKFVPSAVGEFERRFRVAESAEQRVVRHAAQSEDDFKVFHGGDLVG